MAAADESLTPALDQFLDSAKWKKVPSGARAAAWARAAAFEAEHGDPADLRLQHGRSCLPEDQLPLRIMVMWRLVRATAQVKGICAIEETLDEATEGGPGGTDPWTIPFKPVGSPRREAALMRLSASCRLSVLHAQESGLPLLPPPASCPAMLERWCTGAAMIAQDFNMQGPAQALAHLLDPRTCARSDVTKVQVLDFEDLLLSQCLRLLLDKGERRTVEYFRERYDFSRKETEGLLRLTKARALSGSMATVEEKRALQEARLEDFLGRAREAMNMDDEMKALKELGKIQGLTRTDPDNRAFEILAVVRRVSNDQDLELLDPRTAHMIAGHQPEAVDAEVIESRPPRGAGQDADAEALAEFDREKY